MDAKMFQLRDDLAFAKHYKMICELTVEYWDDGKWTFVKSKEEAQERVDGCEKIINSIKKKMEAIDGNQIT